MPELVQTHISSSANQLKVGAVLTAEQMTTVHNNSYLPVEQFGYDVYSLVESALQTEAPFAATLDMRSEFSEVSSRVLPVKLIQQFNWGDNKWLAIRHPDNLNTLFLSYQDLPDDSRFIANDAIGLIEVRRGFDQRSGLVSLQEVHIAAVIERTKVVLSYGGYDKNKRQKEGINGVKSVSLGHVSTVMESLYLSTTAMQHAADEEGSYFWTPPENGNKVSTIKQFSKSGSSKAVRWGWKFFGSDIDFHIYPSMSEAQKQRNRLWALKVPEALNKVGKSYRAEFMKSLEGLAGDVLRG